jgi:pyridoxal phosphate enzyme (YggS family)
MHNSVKNLLKIQDKIKNKTNAIPIIIAVSKNFEQEEIVPLLDYGHQHFGENKVQECVRKWQDLKNKYENIKLHMIGKLQTNKVRDCLKCFDFIHSLDNKKLAKKIYDEQLKQNKKINVFIQINIGDESQKSGVKISELEELLAYCNFLKLEVVGLMCIPPDTNSSKIFFLKMKKLKIKYNQKNLSMGMSSDYMDAIEGSSNFIRIGTSIFGRRK